MSTAFAQLNTSTSRAAVLTFTMPMMSALLAWWWLGERLDRSRRWRWAWAWPVWLVLAWPVLQRAGWADAVPRTPLRGLLLPLLAARLGVWARCCSSAGRCRATASCFTAWQLLIGAAVARWRAGAGEHLPPGHGVSPRVQVALPSTSCPAPRWPTGCGSAAGERSAPRCRR
jgi:drug/metabolite transporter (DMT)-like permease